MSGQIDGAYRIELPVFEGPLDLLLFLVRKHELEILDIPISFITEKYLEHLELMRQLSLDVAAEYLLMAATLAYIKSREMLPTPDVVADDTDSEETGDPRAELIRKLLEYRRYKDAAEQLATRPLLGRDVFTRNPEAELLDGPDAPLAEISIFALVETFGQILARAKIKLSHEILIDRVSVVSRIQELIERLEKERNFTLESCIDITSGEAQVRHMVVVTFLALLEMAKLHLIRLHQISAGGAIYVGRAATEMPQSVVSDFR